MKTPLAEILCIFLIIVLLVTKCNNDRIGNVTGTDTVIVYDTIHSVDTVTKFQTVNSWFAKHDTVFLVNFDTIAIANNDCDSVRESLSYNADSSVKVHSLVHGKMLRQVIDARIVNTTITLRDTIDITKRLSVFAGLDVGMNNVCPNLSVISRSDQFSIGYNLITKSPQLGYSRKLFSK